MTGTSLRFGLMCPGPVLQAWQAAALDDLLAAGSFQLALLIRPAPSPGVRQRGLGKLRDPERRRTLLWRLYQRLRLRRLRSGRPVDRSKAFEAVDVVTCAIERRGRHSEYFSETDIETIRSYDLDFILRFGFGIIQGDILEAARYGVWSYHHDDERVIRGGPPCFWEVARGRVDHRRDPTAPDGRPRCGRRALSRPIRDPLGVRRESRPGFLRVDRLAGPRRPSDPRG